METFTNTSGPAAAPPPTTGSLFSRHPRVRFVLASLALVAGYFLGGKAGLLLAGTNPSVTAVWPPTGIAIAALLLGGSELWPAVFAGAFLVNFTTTGDIASTLGLASGNTLEALVGAYLATRYASGKRFLDSPRTVLTFVLLSGLLASMIAATVGSTSLILARAASPDNFLTLWVPYWLGDTIGAIELAPLLLVLLQRRYAERRALPSPAWPERAVLGAVVLLFALLVFARNPISGLGGLPLVFLVVPPTVWAAFRVGARGAVLSVSSVSVIAIVATVTANGPFASLPAASALLTLRLFIGSLAVTALLVASDTSQHQRLEEELNHARKELLRLLGARTAELNAAQSLAKVGTWSYTVDSKELLWSDEMYRIFGYGETRSPMTTDRALERIAPENRGAVSEQLEEALRSGIAGGDELRESKVRLLLPTGERRTVVSKLRVSETDSGRVTRITGTVVDVTELERVEQELRRLQDLDEDESEPVEDFGLWMIPWGAGRRR